MAEIKSLSTEEVVTKNLWFIRHAESEQNAGVEVGRNSKLSERGKTQAVQVHGPCSLLLLSPLRRSIETYALSGLKVGRLIMADCIREIVDGPACELDLEKWSHNETEEEVMVRINATFQLLRSQPEKNITILSHACFLRKLISELKLEMSGFLANAQVVLFKDVNIPVPKN
jgi:broad specificity phosphatase PhoE